MVGNTVQSTYIERSIDDDNVVNVKIEVKGISFSKTKEILDKLTKDVMREILLLKNEKE